MLEWRLLGQGVTSVALPASIPAGCPEAHGDASGKRRGQREKWRKPVCGADSTAGDEERFLLGRSLDEDTNRLGTRR